MTIQPTDIALVMISLVACVYCFLLGRRLKALQNNKDGLGATISAFTKATSEISLATQQSCQRASQQATTLSDLIRQAETACNLLKQSASDSERRFSSLAQETEERIDVAAQKSEDASRAIEEHLTELLKDAREQNAELTNLTEQMRVLSSQTTDAIRSAITQTALADPEPVFLKPPQTKKSQANGRTKQ